MPLTRLQSAVRSRCARPGLQWYWRADFFNEITDEAIDVHRKYRRSNCPPRSPPCTCTRSTARRTGCRTDATAFAYRDGGWAGVIVGVDPDPANAAD